MSINYLSSQILLSDSPMLETLLRAPALKCGINFSCWFSLACTPGLVLWLLLLLWRGVTVAQASCKAQGVTSAAVMPYRVDARRSCSDAHPWTAKVPDLWAVCSWAEPLFAWAPWKVQMGSTGSPCAVLGAQGCAWGQPRQRWDADWAFSRRRLHPRRFSERILQPVAPQPGPPLGLVCASLPESHGLQVGWESVSFPHGGGVCSARTRLPETLRLHSSWASEKRCQKEDIPADKKY